MNPLPLLQLNPVLASAPSEALAALSKQCEVRQHAPGSPLVLAGSPAKAIYLLGTGRLEIRRRNRAAGTEVLMGALLPPSLLGDAELYGHSRWPHSVRAVVKSRVVHIPCEVFDRFVAKTPAVSYGLYKDACARHMLAINIAQVFALQKTSHRILRLLNTLAPDGEGGAPRKVRVSQSELARSLGLNWKTISRNLEQLETTGLLVRQGRDFLLPLDRSQTWQELRGGFGSEWTLSDKGTKSED